MEDAKATLLAKLPFMAIRNWQNTYELGSSISTTNSQQSLDSLPQRTRARNVSFPPPRGGLSTQFRLRAVSLFSQSPEQNERETKMATSMTEGARRVRPPSFFTSRRLRACALSSLSSSLKKTETARGLTPFISKTKFSCFHAPHRLKTTISTVTNSFIHLLDLVL